MGYLLRKIAPRVLGSIDIVPLAVVGTATYLVARKNPRYAGMAERMEKEAPKLLPFPFNLAFVRNGVQRVIETKLWRRPAGSGAPQLRRRARGGTARDAASNADAA